MLVYMIIATMLIVVGRSPALAGPNHLAPALAAWQFYSEPPPLQRDGIKLARARRTQRVHSTLALLCCTHCAQQVPDGDTDPGSDLTYETARRCLRVCTSVDGCPSAERHHYHPAVPSGVLLEMTTRQQMLFCPRVEMNESRATVAGMFTETHPATGGPAARRSAPHTPTQTHLTEARGFTPLTGKHRSWKNGTDSDRETYMNSVEEISANPRSREAEATGQRERRSISCKVDGFLHTLDSRSCSAEQAVRRGIKELGRDTAVGQLENETMNKMSLGSSRTVKGFTRNTGNSGAYAPLHVHIGYISFPIVSTPRVNKEDSSWDSSMYFVEKLSGFLLSHFAAGAVRFPRSKARCKTECWYSVNTTPMLEVGLDRLNPTELGLIYTDGQREQVNRTVMYLGTTRKSIGSSPLPSTRSHSTHTSYVSLMVDHCVNPPPRRALNCKCTRVRANDSDTNIRSEGRRPPEVAVTIGGELKDNAALILELINKKIKVKTTELNLDLSLREERSQVDATSPAMAPTQIRYDANLISNNMHHQLHMNIEKEKKETCRREELTPTDTRQPFTPDTHSDMISRDDPDQDRRL